MSCHLRGADNLRAGLEQRFHGMSEKDVADRRRLLPGPVRRRAGGFDQRSYLSRRHSGSGRGAGADGARRQRTARACRPELPTDARTLGLASDPYPGAEHYGALRKVVATRDWDGVIAQLKASGLSGLGGAGFPTGMKWEAVRREPRARKIRGLQRRRERAGHHQGPLHHAESAQSGDRGHDHRRPGDRRAEGHPLYPARVSRAGRNSARRDRALLRGEAFWGRACWDRASRSTWSCSSAPADTSAAKRAR